MSLIKDKSFMHVVAHLNGEASKHSEMLYALSPNIFPKNFAAGLFETLVHYADDVEVIELCAKHDLMKINSLIDVLEQRSGRNHEAVRRAKDGRDYIESLIHYVVTELNK